MNKQQFMDVLQAALLWWDGGNPEDYGIDSTCSNIGMNLCSYLRTKPLEVSQ